MSNDPFDLMRQLDEHLPPNQADMIDTADELIEAARRVAEMPPVTLSPAALERLEARLREAAIAAGPPAKHVPKLRPRLLLPVAAALLMVLAGAIIVLDDDKASVVVQPPSATSTASPSPSPTLSPSPSATATATPTVPVPTVELTSPPPQVGTMVVEGPVTSVDGNLIVIYGIAIQLEADNPLTVTIQPGDVLHVAGDIEIGPDGLVVTAVTFTLVNVEVYFNGDTEVFRDDAPCNNPPPAWAPAHGWRARCEEGGSPANNGRGDNDDHDDDDD